MRFLFIITCLLMSPTFLYGLESSYPFSDQIKSYWSQGSEGIKKVRAIYKSRLSSNREDIVGLTLKLEDAMLFSHFEEVEKVTKEIVVSGEGINSKRISERIELLKRQVDGYLRAKDIIPPVPLEKARARLEEGKDIEGIPMVLGSMIQLCEEEGLVSMADLEERKPFNYYWVLIPLVFVIVGAAFYFNRRGRKVGDVSA